MFFSKSKLKLSLEKRLFFLGLVEILTILHLKPYEAMKNNVKSNFIPIKFFFNKN